MLGGKDLLSTIRADMCELGITVASLCPWSKSIIVRLGYAPSGVKKGT